MQAVWSQSCEYTCDRDFGTATRLRLGTYQARECKGPDHVSGIDAFVVVQMFKLVVQVFKLRLRTSLAAALTPLTT
jgi:hypothetical protein